MTVFYEGLTSPPFHRSCAVTLPPPGDAPINLVSTGTQKSEEVHHSSIGLVANMQV